MTNDLISDLLTRIRNAKQRQKKEVEIPASKMNKAILDILEKEGFINGFDLVEQEPQNIFKVSLKYIKGISAISDMKRVSKPGLRKYTGYKDIKKVKNGMGIGIVSTSKGLMTYKQAKSEKIGGEILAEIY